VANPIDESKFGRLTADLLVRKGDAEPSGIRRARRKNRPAPLSMVSAEQSSEQTGEGTAAESGDDADDAELLPPYDVFEHTITQASPKKQHRIMIVLTEEEHETLGILAVKKGYTRHQVLRKALDGYLEWLVDEYGTRCRCISSTCSSGCDHLSAAELAERPTDVE
jgi:hypothetical protein